MVIRYDFMVAALLVTSVVYGMDEVKKEKKHKKEKKSEPLAENTAHKPKSAVDTLAELFIAYEETQNKTMQEGMPARGPNAEEKEHKKNKFKEFFKAHFGKKQKNQKPENKGVEVVAQDELEEVTKLFLGTEKEHELEDMIEVAENIKYFSDKVKTVLEKLFGHKNPTIPVLLSQKFTSKDKDVNRLIDFLKVVNKTDATDKKLGPVVRLYLKPIDPNHPTPTSLLDPLTSKEKFRILMVSIPTVFLVLALKLFLNKRFA